MTRIISEDFSGKSDLFGAKVHLLSTFPFTVKMGSRNRCRNQHNFTFRLSLFRSPIRCIARGLTIQKRRTKSSRFRTLGEPSFRALRNPSSPPLSLTYTYRFRMHASESGTCILRYVCVDIRGRRREGETYVCTALGHKRVHEASEGIVHGPPGACV